MAVFVGKLIAVSMMAMPILLISTEAEAQQLTNEGVPSSDSLIQEAEEDAPRNEFFLDDEQDVELIRFKRIHDIELCAANPDPRSIGSTRKGYAFTVTWDNDVGVILPGNCLTFDAMRVKVKPASRLPEDVQLVGTIKVIR